MAGGSLAFYELAAQIIPVLFLAVMFELRFLGGPGRATTDLFVAVIRVGILLIFVYGEARALHVVAIGQPSNSAQQDVIGALVAGAWLLALYPVSDLARVGRERLPTPVRERATAISRAGRLLVGVGLMVVGVLLVVRAL
jgi:hypothetical protein